MTYIDKNLMQDEAIICHTLPHWIIFSRAGFWLLLAILVFFISAMYPLGHYRFLGLPQLYQLVPMILLCAAIIAFIPAFVKYKSTEFVITNKRILLKKGFVRRTTNEIILSRIESISVYQGMLGRILNYGTILISGTGGSKDPFMDLPQPAYLRNKVQEQIEKL